MDKVRAILLLSLASAGFNSSASAAVPNESVDHSCPISHVDDEEFRNWQKALIVNNGVVSESQLNRILSETKKCALEDGWSDEQAKWVVEINISFLAHEAYSFKMDALGIDTFVDLSHIDTKSISELEAIIQNPDGDADMRSFANAFKERSSVSWSSDHVNATRDYLSSLAAYSLAFIRLTGNGLFAGAIAISE